MELDVSKALLSPGTEFPFSAEVTVPPGYWVDWGGQFENLIAARERLMIVVPACFALIFLLLYSALGSARDSSHHQPRP